MNCMFMSCCGTGLGVISLGVIMESCLKECSSEQPPFWPQWGLQAAHAPTACLHPVKRKPYQGASVPISSCWEGEIAFHNAFEHSHTIPPRERPRVPKLLPAEPTLSEAPAHPLLACLSQASRQALVYLLLLTLMQLPAAANPAPANGFCRTEMRLSSSKHPAHGSADFEHLHSPASAQQLRGCHYCFSHPAHANRCQL